MKKTMTFAVSVVFLSASLALPSFAEVKAGMPCKQAGKVIQTAGMKYKCVKSGKKLVWGKGQLTVKATPTPGPTVFVTNPVDKTLADLVKSLQSQLTVLNMKLKTICAVKPKPKGC